MGPLILSISINDLLFFSAKCEICIFADNSSFYSIGIDLENFSSNLKNDT